MNREIKFRAWDKENGEMIYSDREYIDFYFAINNNSVVCINVEDYDDSFGYTQTSSCELDNIMQYTGLKDKYDKEIYEVDIIKISNHPYKDFNGIFEVGYNENMVLVAGDILLHRFTKYCEVIGNIYENPELLEVENE